MSPSRTASWQDVGNFHSQGCDTVSVSPTGCSPAEKPPFLMCPCSPPAHPSLPTTPLTLLGSGWSLR